MAELKNSLQELVECPICYEVFNRPKALPCLHTLCSDCVDQTASWSGQIKCPFCSKRFNTRDAKADFRTQQLVDLYLTLDLEIGFANLTLQENPDLVDERGDGNRQEIGNEQENEGQGVRAMLHSILSVTPPQFTRIKHVLRRSDGFWFILNNGAIWSHTGHHQVAKPKLLYVTDKPSMRPSVVGGLVTGLATAALFNPVAGIVAGIAAGVATTLGSSLRRNTDCQDMKYRVRHLCSTSNQDRLIAVCEIDAQHAPNKRLLLINKRCQIEGAISENGGYHVEDIKSMFTIGEKLYTANGRDVQVWSRNRRTTDGLWDLSNMCKLRLAKTQGVQFCADGRHGYSMDGKSVYKCTKLTELVSAHNIPKNLAGNVELVNAVDGRVLLQHRPGKTLHMLNTDTNSWTELHIPEMNWKPVSAYLERKPATTGAQCDVTVLVLCSSAGRSDNRVYTLEA